MAKNYWIVLFVALVKVKQFRSILRRLARKFGKPQEDGFKQSAPRVLPRNIWIYWDRGLDAAPEVVKMCIESWQIKNPGWAVHILDQDTVSEFISMSESLSEMPVQAYSDLLRLRLLKEHGGVWVDATAYCVRPLDEWLPIVAQRGFFAFFWTPETHWFAWPGYNREVATWFLASEPGNLIIADWESYSFRYWESRHAPHSYFWCHTLFELLGYMHRPFGRALRSVPKIGCHGPHIVLDCIMRERDTSLVAPIIDSGAAPVQKLRWQWEGETLVTVKKLLHVHKAVGSSEL